MDHSENLNELGAALAKAQGAIRNAARDSENPFFKSSYADLASVWNACRGPLTENGLAVVQAIQSVGEVLYVETMLLHSSGQWISATVQTPIEKPNAQGYGSAITYFRRYALAAIVGVAQEGEDDDGDAATRRNDDNHEGPKTAPRSRGKQAGKNPTKSHTPVNAESSESSSAEHIQRAKDAFQRFCFVVAQETGRAIEGVRAEERARVYGLFGIRSSDDLTPDQARELVEYLRDEEEKLSGPTHN